MPEQAVLWVWTGVGVGLLQQYLGAHAGSLVKNLVRAELGLRQGQSRGQSQRLTSGLQPRAGSEVPSGRGRVRLGPGQTFSLMGGIGSSSALLALPALSTSAAECMDTGGLLRALVLEVSSLSPRGPGNLRAASGPLLPMYVPGGKGRRSAQLAQTPQQPKGSVITSHMCAALCIAHKTPSYQRLYISSIVLRDRHDRS